MSLPVEQLGAACFSENANLFGNPKTQPEKYNLYTGLRAMSQTIESLTQTVHKLERQLNSVNQKLDVLSQK